MKISDIISVWYKKNKRNLPWRETSDPYKIWISEIILQQTRVEQGKGYYLRFIERFQDLSELARADEQEVIKMWQGLGYYSRARNLHAAARQVMQLYNGNFPTSYNSLIKLKGVGPYTAAAVASISSNEAVAVVDGNVSRVISRLFAVPEAINSGRGGKMIRELANEILDKKYPGEHNQAMMEFGALQCTPRNPDCRICPLLTKCEAQRRGLVKELPLKIKKGPVKERYFTYLILNHEGYTYIYKRKENDIWKQLFEFPLIEHKRRSEMDHFEDVMQRLTNLKAGDFVIRAISKPLRHQLTHRSIIAQFIHIDLSIPVYPAPENWLKITFSQLSDYPVPRLIERYLETDGIAIQ